MFATLTRVLCLLITFTSLVGQSWAVPVRRAGSSMPPAESSNRQSVAVLFGQDSWRNVQQPSRAPIQAVGAVDDSHTGDLLDDATSRFTGRITPDGSDVPVAVMQYLLMERHGVDEHKYAPLRVRPGMQNDFLHDLDEMLKNPRTGVSPFAFNGEVYFLASPHEWDSPDNERWARFLQIPQLIPYENLQPSVIGRLDRQPLASGEARYGVFSIQTPITSEDSAHFRRSFLHNRQLMRFRDLLDEVRDGRFFTRHF